MQQSGMPYKRLYRSRNQRVIAGVCGGLGDYFGVDPTWVRLFFILFFIAFGSTLLLYIVLWIIVPVGPESPSSFHNLS
jgi:phage shock protein C